MTERFQRYVDWVIAQKFGPLTSLTLAVFVPIALLTAALNGMFWLAVWLA